MQPNFQGNQNIQQPQNGQNSSPATLPKKTYRYLCCTFNDPESMYIEATCYDMIPQIFYIIPMFGFCCFGFISLFAWMYIFTLKLELSKCCFDPFKLPQRRQVMGRMFAARRFLWIFTAIIYVFQSLLMLLFLLMTIPHIGSVIFYFVFFLVFVAIAIHSFYMAFIPSFAEGVQDIRNLGNQVIQNQYYRGDQQQQMMNMGNPFQNNQNRPQYQYPQNNQQQQQQANTMEMDKLPPIINTRIGENAKGSNNNYV